MSFRNLSPQAMFERMALDHQPRARFAATTSEDFQAWKESTLPAVIGTLGEFPERVPLNPQLLAEWTEEDVTRQRWLIDVGPHISATLYVNSPASITAGAKLPAIQCWHGHSTEGKTLVMGTGATPEVRASIERTNYNFGFQMAQQGYVTYAIDWFGKGDRNDAGKPNWRSNGKGRDWCNLYYLNATMLGMTPLSINVTHGMAATDFVSTLPMVDASRLGVMGISGGGTMTLWSALCDDRFSAAEIICYSDLWAHFGVRDLNYCGMQVAPGLFRHVDLPDLQGLLAPLPLLVNIGAEDDCFLVDTAMECFRQVTHIYDVAGHPDKLELDLHPGGHAWGGNRSEAFFRHHLITSA
jgi:dienelactone hydrolase